MQGATFVLAVAIVASSSSRTKSEKKNTQVEPYIGLGTSSSSLKPRDEQ